MRVRVVAGVIVHMIARVWRVIVPVCVVPVPVTVRLPVAVSVVVRVVVHVVVHVVVRVVVPVLVTMSCVRRMQVSTSEPRSVVSARLGLEGATRRRDLEAHACEQLCEHVVRLEHEAIGTHLERNVAVAEVVRGLGERERGACRLAVRGRGDDEDRLRERLDADQRAVFADEDVAAADDATARQEHGEAPAGGVERLEAALLARVPVEGDDAGTAHQRGGEAAAGADQLADDDEGHGRRRRVRLRN